MPVLPDILEPGLAVVFCGTAASPESARRGCYYAGPGNRFWPVLHAVGLTRRELAPEEFREVTHFGIGLTDVVKRASGTDAQLPAEAYDVHGFRNKILRFAPRVVAFNGKNAAKAGLGRTRVGYGRVRERLGDSAVFVLPSTSAAAKKYWDVRHWQALARYLER